MPPCWAQRPPAMHCHYSLLQSGMRIMRRYIVWCALCERYNVWSALRGCTCLAGMCVWFPVEIMCALCDHSPNAVCAHYARVRASYITTDRSSSFYQPRYGWSCDGIARRAARHLDVMVCGTVVILYSPRLLAGSAPPVHPFHQSVSLPIAASQTPQWPRAQHHTYALKNMTLQHIHL